MNSFAYQRLIRWFYRRGGQRQGDEAGSMGQPATPRYGFASTAWYRALPGASRTWKIIGKRCAGKLHARFERGLHGNGPSLKGGTAP